jgi:exosortase/archaeosortase family protein
VTSRTLAILLRPVSVIALVMITFVLANAGFRQLEAAAATQLLHLSGLTETHRVLLLPGSRIAVFPEAVGPFVAVVTPSCSALSALLAVAFLAWFGPPGRIGRRIGALGCALVCVLAGNVLRIAGSIGVGLVHGKASLVLFHDWVGSLFAFGYTLGGYLLMLFLLLPAAVAARDGRGAHRASV